MFIAFEGIDGSGKTIQAKLLSDRLNSLGIFHILTKEPGATDYGVLVYESILGNRLSPIAQCLRFCADRAQHYKEVIDPALRRGRWIVSVRSLYSAIAYDGYGAGVDLTLIDRIHKAIPARKPDIVVWLDPSLSFAKKNLRGRQGNKLDYKPDLFWEKVQVGYEIALQRADCIRIKSEGAIDEISGQIFTEIKSRVQPLFPEIVFE